MSAAASPSWALFSYYPYLIDTHRIVLFGELIA